MRAVGQQSDLCNERSQLAPFQVGGPWVGHISAIRLSDTCRVALVRR